MVRPGNDQSISLLQYAVILPLVAVPVLPKVSVFSLAGSPILLDDLALGMAIAFALFSFICRSSVLGSSKVLLSRLGFLSLALVLYKCLDLGVLSLFYPWVDLSGIGRGVLVGEGIMVLGKTAALVLVYILFYNLLKTRQHAHLVLKLYILSVTIVVTIGLIQVFVLGHPVMTSTFRNIYALSQVNVGWQWDDPWFGASSVGHEHLGSFMILAGSILGGMLLCKWPGQKGKRHLLAILWIGCVFSLVFSSSRGAWIGGICALTMFAWFAFERKKGMSFLLVAFVGSVSFIALLRWVWNMDVVAYVGTRIVDLSDVRSGVVKDDSGRLRIRLFWSLWDAFLNNPISGWGPGGAGRIAEGQWIRELVEGGIIGGVLFLYIMMRNGWIAVRSYRLSDDPMVQGMSIGFVCGLVGLLGQSLFTELFILTKIGVPFWMLAAVVHRLYRFEQQRYAPS